MKQTKIFLNLRSIPCPLNVVKCKLALEKLTKEDILFLELDKGEPQSMVTQTLRNMGYAIKVVNEEKDWVQCVISYGNI